MSLVVSVQVNGQSPLAYLIVRRTKGGVKSSDVNTYEYKVYSQSKGGFAHMKVIAKGDLEHRYGDGALALLRQVCEVADL